MFKKVLTMALAVAMLISCFGAVVSADYGYYYGEQIAKKTGGEGATANAATDANAGDTVTGKSNNFVNAQPGTRNFFYLYNYDEATGNYIRDDEGIETIRSAPYIAFDLYYNRTFVNFYERTYQFKTAGTGHAGKYFFTKGTKAAIPTFTVKQKSTATLYNATTKTYEFDIKFGEGADYPKSILKIYTSSGKAFNVLGIDEEGYLRSGALAWNTEQIDKLEKGREYTISVVMDLVETETAGSYDVYKKIYVRDNSAENPEFALRFYTRVNTGVACDPSYLQCDLEFYPFTSEAVTDANLWQKLISNNETTNFYASEPSSSKASYAPEAGAINFKYQLKNVDFYIDDFAIYAGNIHGVATESLTDGEHLKLFASSSVNTINVPDPQRFTIAAEATSEASVTGGKIVLATYTPNGILQNVVAENLNITPGAIAETYLSIPKVQAIDAVYKVMYLDDLGNLVPLSNAATFVQPEIWTDPALAD